jgi:hypothetical protein
MYLTIVPELSTATLNMLDLVVTSELDFRRKTLLNSTTLDIGYKHTRSIYAIDVLPK